MSHDSARLTMDRRITTASPPRDTFLKARQVLSLERAGMMAYHFTFEASDGTRRSAVLEGPHGAPCVLLCHGLFGHKNGPNTLELVKRLTASGIASFRFDFAGRGDSEGGPQLLSVGGALQELEDAWRALLLRSDGDLSRLALHGSSFGGLAAALFAAENPLCKALALRSPVVDGAALSLRLIASAQHVGPEMALSQWRERGVASLPNPAGGEYRLEFAYYEDAVRMSLLERAGRIECPVLIVHGSRDESIPLEDVERLYARIAAEKQLKIFEAAHHVEDRKTLDAMMAALVAFFEKALL
jgi:uncharacterized protein